jgi:hypothetical protein
VHLLTTFLSGAWDVNGLTRHGKNSVRIGPFAKNDIRRFVHSPANIGLNTIDVSLQSALGPIEYCARMKVTCRIDWNSAASFDLKQDPETNAYGETE